MEKEVCWPHWVRVNELKCSLLMLLFNVWRWKWGRCAVGSLGSHHLSPALLTAPSHSLLFCSSFLSSVMAWERTLPNWTCPVGTGYFLVDSQVGPCLLYWNFATQISVCKKKKIQGVHLQTWKKDPESDKGKTRMLSLHGACTQCQVCVL